MTRNIILFHVLFSGRFIEPAPCEYTTDFMNSNIADIYKMYQLTETIEGPNIDTRTESKLNTCSLQFSL